MGNQDKFEVLVSDYTSSIEEWRRAMSVPPSELPELTQQQQQVARRFGITEEEYKRGVLAGKYGEARMKDRGRGLGRAIEGIVSGLGPDYRLLAVKAEMFNGRWVVRIQGPEKVANIAVSRELVDDVLDAGTPEELEKLKACVLVGLGRHELIVRR